MSHEGDISLILNRNWLWLLFCRRRPDLSFRDSRVMAEAVGQRP